MPFKVYSMMINMMQRVVTNDQDIQNLGAYESEQRSRFQEILNLKQKVFEKDDPEYKDQPEKPLLVVRSFKDEYLSHFSW